MSRPVTPTPGTLLIACGALAREVTHLLDVNDWRHITVSCLPAKLHNAPDQIAGRVREKIRKNRGAYDRILVAYGDCGTGGALDRVLAEEGAERIAGPHCYEFFAGAADFAALCDEAPGSFFLTDYLVRHFDRLIVEGLGLDRFPQLLGDYFGNYARLVYLAQTEDPELRKKAEAAATRLGLAFEYRFTGYGELATFLEKAEERETGHG